MEIDGKTMRTLDAVVALKESGSGYSPSLGVRHTFTFLENTFTIYAIWEMDRICILTSYDDEIAEYRKDETDGFRCTIYDLSGLISATAEDVMTQIARKAAPEIGALRLSELINRSFREAGIRHSDLLVSSCHIHPTDYER